MADQLYPKWKFHKTKDAIMVADEAAEKALGAGWVDHPDQLNKPVTPKPVAPAAPVAPKPVTPKV